MASNTPPKRSHLVKAFFNLFENMNPQELDLITTFLLSFENVVEQVREMDGDIEGKSVSKTHL